ncbi:MAG: hypothetical protein QM742_01385 [Aquabacterium sp.]
MRELTSIEIGHISAGATSGTGSTPVNPIAAILAIPAALILFPLLIGSLYNPGGGNVENWWYGVETIFGF